MSFKKRILNEETIRLFAKSNTFHWFQRYMVHADAFIIEGSDNDWPSIIHKRFCDLEEDSEERVEMHRKIANNEI